MVLPVTRFSIARTRTGRTSGATVSSARWQAASSNAAIAAHAILAVEPCKP
jgi:hypothetical protein